MSHDNAIDELARILTAFVYEFWNEFRALKPGPSRQKKALTAAGTKVTDDGYPFHFDEYSVLRSELAGELMYKLLKLCNVRVAMARRRGHALIAERLADSFVMSLVELTPGASNRENIEALKTAIVALAVYKFDSLIGK